MSTDTATATRTSAADWAIAAARYETAANESAARSARSFEGCDTDGFVTQWAGDSMARLYRAQAEWARGFGMVGTQVLLTTDGKIASTHQGHGIYGEYWVLNDVETARYGRRFFNPSKAARYDRQAKANAKKGYVVAWALVEGYVKNDGSGHGLSGALTVAPREFPNVDALKAHQVGIVDHDFLMTLSADYDGRD